MCPFCSLEDEHKFYLYHSLSLSVTALILGNSQFSWHMTSIVFAGERRLHGSFSSCIVALVAFQWDVVERSRELLCCILYFTVSIYVQYNIVCRYFRYATLNYDS